MTDQSSTQQPPDVAAWWPKITDESREWLIAHTREKLPPEVWLDVAAAGGEASGGYWPSVENSLSGFDLPSADWDLIEKYLNEK